MVIDLMQFIIAMADLQISQNGVKVCSEGCSLFSMYRASKLSRYTIVSLCSQSIKVPAVLRRSIYCIPSLTAAQKILLL